MPDALLEVDGIAKRFGKNHALRGVTLSVPEGETLAILGQSGSGKTTLLRIVAGLIRPDVGTVYIDGAPQSHIPPEQRGIGFVFQTTSALFPHMTVFENVAFPYRVADEREHPNWKQRVGMLLHRVGLEGQRDQHIGTLSGGQQQRVALAQALARRPRLLLLDEPLRSLDNVNRASFVELFLALREEEQLTTVYVTHDEREALEVADNVAMLRDGLLEQRGRLDQVMTNPLTPHVAELLGCWNMLEGKPTTPGKSEIALGQDSAAEARIDLGTGVTVSDQVRIAIHINDCMLIGKGEAVPDEHSALPCEIIRVFPWYHSQRALVSCCGFVLRVELAEEAARAASGDKFILCFKTAALRVF